MIKLLIGFVLGLVVYAWWYDRMATLRPADLVEADDKGRKDALKTNPVSTELEMTCAGLWMGQQQAR